MARVISLLLLCVGLAAAEYTCEEYGFACTANTFSIPSDHTLCIGDCSASLVDKTVNVIVAPGKRFKFSDTLFAQTDTITGDTWWFTDINGTETRQFTVHGAAVFVGSAPPVLGTPTTGVFITGEKISSTTDDGVWARKSRINIVSPHDGSVIGYQDYVYLAGAQAKRGFLFELSNEPNSRVVLTGNQIILGPASTNLILQNTDASVIATGDIVVERAMYPQSHVSCLDVPITGKQNILKMVAHAPPSSCAVVYPIHTAINSVELDSSHCYAMDDPEFSTMYARLLVDTPLLASTRFFKIPVGCAAVTGPTIAVNTYTDAGCTADLLTYVFLLGECNSNKYVITCERQVL